MGGASGTHGGERKCVNAFGLGVWKENSSKIQVQMEGKYYNGL
jgi:hypothetical protein